MSFLGELIALSEAKGLKFSFSGTQYAHMMEPSRSPGLECGQDCNTIFKHSTNGCEDNYILLLNYLLSH